MNEIIDIVNEINWLCKENDRLMGIDEPERPDIPHLEPIDGTEQ